MTGGQNSPRLSLGTRLSRLVPDNIAARIALTMVLALLVTQAIGACVYLISRPPRPPHYGPGVAGQHIVAIVRLVEETAQEQRQAALDALDEPVLDVEWMRSQPADGGWTRVPSRRFAHHLAMELGNPARDVIVEVRDEPSLGSHLGPTPPPIAGGDPFNPFGQLRATVGLNDGTWLVFSRKDPHGPFRLLRFAVWMALIGAAVAALSLWAARRITAPLASFVGAAERLGIDAAAPPLPEAGPAELRAATRAVNHMQDRLRRFVADRTRMLAAIGHDLRTPLTRLRLRAEFVEDAELQRKMLGDLDEMEAMVTATLAFARDDAQREARTATDLADLLQSLCEDRVDAGHSASYQGPPHFPLNCRPVALRRALANLIDNAIHYGRGARVSLDGSRPEAVIAIEDDGPGIPEPEQERVFAPFFRLEPSRSRDTGGAGLGLSVARSIVRGHGGDIALANRAGGGLTVTVNLPG
ncbi:MAG: HAMP domain-containing protein [Azospirillum sp.]|nr:HAMP domain-containing protein [Azospirillum sp.]